MSNVNFKCVHNDKRTIGSWVATMQAMRVGPVGGNYKFLILEVVDEGMPLRTTNDVVSMNIKLKA